MATTYVVTAPYITVATGTPDGRRLVGFYTGAVLPDDVSEESIQHHLDSGLIAKAGEAEEELAAQPGELPSNTGSVPGEPVPGEPATVAEPPAGNASLEDWQSYALAKGATDSDLVGKSRNDLRDQYGQ